MDNNIEELYKLHHTMVSWIGDMILRNEIRLRDVPADIRRSSEKIYICAFRASRSCSCNRFISDVQVLCDDITMLYDNDDEKKARLIALLSQYLQLSDYKGEERFESFKKNMDEKILRELCNYQHSHDKQFCTMLRKYKTDKGAAYTAKSKRTK